MNFIKRSLKKKLKRNILINCRTHENNDNDIKFKCDFLKMKFFFYDPVSKVALQGYIRYCN